VEEWVGSSDDAAIPARVKLRIFNRCGGVCHLSGKKIRPGDAFEFDHIIAIANGGRHAEFNLAPALVAPHKIKTAEDRRKKKKSDRVRKKHFGMHEAKRPMPGGRKSREKITWGPNGNKIVIDRITGEQIWPRI
jgi:5-methylcytosine-specific restriction endonuclease McrA